MHIIQQAETPRYKITLTQFFVLGGGFTVSLLEQETEECSHRTTETIDEALSVANNYAHLRNFPADQQFPLTPADYRKIGDHYRQA